MPMEASIPRPQSRAVSGFEHTFAWPYEQEEPCGRSRCYGFSSDDDKSCFIANYYFVSDSSLFAQELRRNRELGSGMAARAPGWWVPGRGGPDGAPRQVTGMTGPVSAFTLVVVAGSAKLLRRERAGGSLPWGMG